MQRAMKTVFDRARSSAINKARQDRIKGVLNELRTVSPIKTAVDLGCGVGIFSKFLTDLGMEVVGVEGRLENITEAQRRYPTIKFNQWDVEDPAIANLLIRSGAVHWVVIPPGESVQGAEEYRQIGGAVYHCGECSSP
jgi:2-polyprenyl-3-methyl-5-hydroxy-6-metoxy-1,4-benzoquinol methylase